MFLKSLQMAVIPSKKCALKINQDRVDMVYECVEAGDTFLREGVPQRNTSWVKQASLALSRQKKVL